MPKAKSRLINAIAKKKQKLQQKPYSKPLHKGISPKSSKVQSSSPSETKSRQQQQQQQQQPSKKNKSLPNKQNEESQQKDEATIPKRKWPKIPFPKEATILLVGEGDFSFSSSLTRMGYVRIMATVYDTEEECYQKYAKSRKNVEVIRERKGRCEFGVDAKVLGKRKVVRDGWRSLREVPVPVNNEDEHEDDEEGEGDDSENEHWHGQNGRSEAKDEKRGQEGWDAIIFNFPHVGGLSTDINRQVRHNQELIVSFLKTSSPLLNSRQGLILLTTFEGHHPYTLWNLRDLIRHSGLLKIERSWKFCWEMWGDYRHVRTLGDLEGGIGDGRGGGWKGEDRDARTFCLRLKEWEEDPGGNSRSKKGGDDEESDDDSE